MSLDHQSPIIAELHAKQAITEVLYRYCRGMDRMDREIAETVWHPGGTADYGPATGTSTATEFLDFVFGYHASMQAHSHTISNLLINVDEGGGEARSEAYVSIWLRTLPTDGKVTDLFHRGRYLDRFTRREGDWRIDHRIFVGDLYREVEVPAPDPVPPWGRRDPDDASYRVLGNCSDAG
ncbi:nuclear transport factor 2 family protein [Gordonia sp. CPCC 206044]|uniref:nuclear transport factor 2 family protein n=1 Tax=Gordonia sp. CPCC 206044 TaxID=3140793 RepID=UPI003AF366A4